MSRRFRLTAALAVVALSVSSCGVNPEDAKRTLSGMGMTDIRLGGRPLFACSKGDNYASEFEAKGPSGQKVKGVICGGIFKSYTVRFY